MESDNNQAKNIINIIIDTVDGPVEERLDLDSLPLDEVADLAVLVPSLKEYYGTRLVKELRD
jgi:hypothetical protein